MQISWQGFSCFEITAKNSSGEVRLITDPYDNSTGLRVPRTLEAEIVAVSHQAPDANNVSAVSESPFVVKMPGEYEVREVFVFGISAPLKDNETKAGKGHMIFRIEAEGMRVAHLGALNRELTDNELESLQNIDILMIPVGGGRVLSPSLATKVIEQVEPRVVIPMTHGIPNVKEELATVEDFCNELGVCRKEQAAKYKIRRKDLPDEDMLVMVLTR